MENSKEDKLFICRIRKTLQKYNLPSPEEILEHPPKKQQWKNAMKKDINSFWYDKWTNEKQIKSTLEYLEIQQNPIGTPHNILRSSISSGDGRLYFWSVFLILQMNNLSSFEFSISHMGISFSMDESSLAKVVNKIIAFLSSVVSIGSAPISA
jgi:hypothetical protein